MRKILRGVLVGLFLLFAWPWFLYKKYGNVKYRPEGKTIIAANHYSNFDAFFIYLMYGRKKIYFAAIDGSKTRCVPRFITWLFDCVFVETEGYNYKFIRKCIDILNRGGIICIFPEGVINPRKFGFFDFKNSFVYFAKKTGAKILPVYVYPELNPFKRSKLYIGDVIPAEEIADKSADGASIYVQCKIAEYSNLLEQIKNKSPK